MTKLVYGKNKQVKFRSEDEKTEAFEYLTTSKDVEFRHEHNEEQGAWGSEKRIHFTSEIGVPESLRRNWTPGPGGRVLWRINCAELYDEVISLRKS